LRLWHVWGKLAHWAKIWRTASAPFFKTSAGIFIDLDHYYAAQWHTQQIKNFILNAHHNPHSATLTLKQELHRCVAFFATYSVQLPLLTGWHTTVFDIFKDYTWSIEQAQSRFAAPFCYMRHSAFALEDLPSSYLGFFAEITSTPFSKMIDLLGGGSSTREMPDPEHQFQNFAFLPLDPASGYLTHRRWSPALTLPEEFSEPATMRSWRKHRSGILFSLGQKQFSIWLENVPLS
jgi:hypothetical protein